MAANEVENHLLSKLDHSITESECHNHLSENLFSLQSQFKNLKDLLKDRKMVQSKRREKLYYLNNVITEWLIVSQNRSSYSWESIRFAFNLSRNLGKIRKDLGGDDHATSADSENQTNRVLNKGSKTSVPGDDPPKENRDDHAMSVDSENRTSRELIEGSKTSVSDVDPTKVYGFDDLAMSLERLLVKENRDGFTAIGIVGMAGVGKTTLCQLVFNGQMVRNRFLPRVWVSMPRPQEGDVGHMRKKIAREIMLSLGVEEEIVNSAGEDETDALRRLILALRRQLIGKRYLIVLDNVWNSEIYSRDSNSDSTDEEALAYGLPKGGGGAVILTSRSPAVAKKIVGGEENLRWIRPLPDGDSCWMIFRDAFIKDGTDFPQQLESQKANIVGKCAGLPVSAKLMGEIMKKNK